MRKHLLEEELLGLAENHLAPNYKPFPVIARSAKGCWITDVEGRVYMDMLSGYSVLNLGHGHPRILKALREQVERIAVFPRAFQTEELILFAKELAEFCGMEMILPMSSGAEAVETAIKLARKWAYTRKGVAKDKAEIIVCDNNFHGRTTTIVGFSSEPQYRDLFGPATPGFKSVPFGDHEVFLKAITPNTAAFLVEPIQGEGGIIVPPEGYLSKCREICRRNNVLFIADEIQTGFARTGRMFACDRENVKPDIFILGKALGGGVLPVSAIAGSAELLRVFEPGDHGSTFGGNPLACHIAREALRILRKGRFDERAEELGGYLMLGLGDINRRFIKEIRGQGLLIGVELEKEGPDAHEFCGRLSKKGILCKETKKYVIRFSPPLTITKRQLDWALKRIRQVLT